MSSLAVIFINGPVAVLNTRNGKFTLDNVGLVQFESTKICLTIEKVLKIVNPGDVRQFVIVHDECPFMDIKALMEALCKAGFVRVMMVQLQSVVLQAILLQRQLSFFENEHILVSFGQNPVFTSLWKFSKQKLTFQEHIKRDSADDAQLIEKVNHWIDEYQCTRWLTYDAAGTKAMIEANFSMMMVIEEANALSQNVLARAALWRAEAVEKVVSGVEVSNFHCRGFKLFDLNSMKKLAGKESIPLPYSDICDWSKGKRQIRLMLDGNLNAFESSELHEWRICLTFDHNGQADVQFEQKIQPSPAVLEVGEALVALRGFVMKEQPAAPCYLIVVRLAETQCESVLYNLATAGGDLEYITEFTNADMKSELMRNNQRHWLTRVAALVNFPAEGGEASKHFDDKDTTYTVESVEEAKLEVLRQELANLLRNYDVSVDSVRGVLLLDECHKVPLLNNLLCWQFPNAKIVSPAGADLEALYEQGLRFSPTSAT